MLYKIKNNFSFRSPVIRHKISLKLNLQISASKRHICASQKGRNIWRPEISENIWIYFCYSSERFNPDQARNPDQASGPKQGS